MTIEQGQVQPSAADAAERLEALYPDDLPAAGQVEPDASASGHEARQGADKQTAESPKEPDQSEPGPYKLTAPDGFVIDRELLTTATPVFREIGLVDEQVNKLLPLVPQLEDRLLDSLDDEHSALKAQWARQTHADPQIGGSNWRETERLCGLALNAGGAAAGSEVRELLDQSGLGNHPAFVRLFRALGDKLSRAGVASAKPKDRLSALYPND